MIVFKFYDGIAAFILGGYCAITGIVYHAFWTYPRFWSPERGLSTYLGLLQEFGLVGGLIFIMYASGFIEEVGSDIEQVSALTGTG